MLDSALELCSFSVEFKFMLSFSAVDVVRSSLHGEQNLSQKCLSPVSGLLFFFFFLNHLKI